MKYVFFHIRIAAVLLIAGLALPALALDGAGPSADEVSQTVQMRTDAEADARPDGSHTSGAEAAGSPGLTAADRAGYVADMLTRIQQRIDLAIRGTSEVGLNARAAATGLAAEISSRGALRTFVLLLLVPALAIGLERLFTYLSGHHWQRQITGAVPTGLHACGRAISFAVGALLPFIFFAWTPLLQSTVAILAIAAVVIRVIYLTSSYIIWLIDQPLAHEPPAPDTPAQAEGEPMSLPEEHPEGEGQSPQTNAAMATEVEPSVSSDQTRRSGHLRRITPERTRYWISRFQRGLSFLVAGWTTIELMGLFGFSEGATLLVKFVFDFILFAIVVEAIWSRPEWIEHSQTVRKAWSWVATVTTIAFLMLWLTGLHLLFWVGILSFVLPALLRLITGVVARLHGGCEIMRPRSVGFVVAERGVRAAVIFLSVWWIATEAGVDASGMMGEGRSLVNRIAHAATQTIAILLVADILWQFAKAEIAVLMSNDPADRRLTDDERARNARVRTLLPILRNILAITLATVAGMMVLTSVGVDIGPLIAGAGVAGIAIGFGAQTIVKDLISGIFYLWDDAFRIGEYIETGKYKGVVESFSLRSVKLRHHRGPLTTVPFGELGAVQNMSRDWVVIKFNLSVTYDTDLEKLRKVIKRVGADVGEMPDYKDNLIEPLKMKGVMEFGEYAIIVRVGFTAKPGEQFMIRREIMTRINLAFKENGIEFAYPTVRVGGQSGDVDADAAATHYRSRQKALATAANKPAAP